MRYLPLLLLLAACTKPVTLVNKAGNSITCQDSGNDHEASDCMKNAEAQGYYPIMQAAPYINVQQKAN